MKLCPLRRLVSACDRWTTLRTGRRKTAAVAVAVVLLFACSSWGYLVHRTVGQLAIYQLPKAMKGFYWKHEDSIVVQSVRPDVRRNSDKTEGPKHFIDLEYYGDSAGWKMPMDMAAAVRKYSLDTLHKYGYVPYVVLEVLGQLTEAFRKGDMDSVLFYSIDLGHYIGDAHVPLHTAINYDGQLSGQKGIHALWESTVPDQLINGWKLRHRHKASYISDPAGAIWETIRQTHALLPALFEAERTASVGVADTVKYETVYRYGKNMRVYTAAFAKIYGAQVAEMVAEQLRKTADQIADLWYTAWVNAGRPELGEGKLTREGRRRLKVEEKAYKKNKLVERHLLRSRDQPGWE